MYILVTSIIIYKSINGQFADVGWHTTSYIPSITDLLLVQFDRYGCVAGYDCGVDTMIVRTPLVSVDDEKSKLNWSVYPNPFDDNFTITNVSSGIVQFSITNIMGDVIYSQIRHQDEEVLQINTIYWPVGIYLINAIDKYGAVLQSQRLVRI